MDETNPYINAVYRSPEWQFRAEGAESPTTAGFRFDINNQEYYFVPRSVFEKGVVSNKTNYFFPTVLTADFEQQIAPYSQQYTPQQVYDTLYNYSTAVSPNENKWLQDVKAAGYKEDEPGFLIPVRVVQNLVPEAKAFDLGSKFGTKYGDVQFSGIQGIGTKDGQKVFVTDVSGSSGPNAQAFIAPSGDLNYSTYKEPASWAKAANVVGWTLIGLGTAGMAGFGPLAGGGATAGATTGATAGATTGATAGGLGGAGAGGITGITAGTTATGLGGSALGTGLTAGTTATGIGGGALGTGLTAGAAGAGLTAGASSAAIPGLLEGATFPTQGLQVPAINSSQVALIPEGTALAGQGLQVPTIPGLSAMGGAQGLTVGVPGGTVTQLGFVPTGATPVLGDPASFINNPDVLGNTVFTTDTLTPPGAATSGMSATDALRALNAANQLLNPAGQNPLVPQQQGLPGRAAGTVDYSGILALLQRQATTPGVSSLLAPAQLKQMYQPLLTPSTLSLLG